MSIWLIFNDFPDIGTATSYITIQQFSIPNLLNFLCTGGKIVTKYGTNPYTMDLCEVDGGGKPVGGSTGPYLARQTFNGDDVAPTWREWTWPAPVILTKSTQYCLRCNLASSRRWYLGTPGGVIGNAFYWSGVDWPSLGDLTIGIKGDYIAPPCGAGIMGLLKPPI